MSTFPGEESPRQLATAWQSIYLLALLAFAIITADILPTSMLPQMAAGLDASEGLVGQAVTAAAVVAIVTSLSIATITGRRDRRVILIGATALLVATNIAIAIAPNVWTVLLARLAFGATVGVVWGLMPAIALRLAPAGHVARALSIIIAGAAVSGIVAAPIAAYLGELIGWRWVYAGATFFSVVALLALIATLPAMPVAGVEKAPSLRATLALPRLLPGMVAMMLVFGGAQIFFTYMVPFLEDVAGLNPSMVSIALLVVGIAGFGGTVIAARFLEISIHLTITLAAVAMAAATLLMLPLGRVVLIGLPLIGLWSFSRSIVQVGGNAWVARAFPANVEGAGGVLVAFIQASIMIGALVGGVLIDTIGPKAPAITAVGILVVAVVYASSALKPAAEPAPSPIA